MNRQLSFIAIVFALLFWGLRASGQSPEWRIESTNGIPDKLVWQAESGKSYDLWQSTDLAIWTHVEGFPQDGTSVEMSFSFTAANRRFFKICTATSANGEFVLIPAGSFQMGDPTGDTVVFYKEYPVHSVYVSSFYMGKYEVSNELWDEVRSWGLNYGYTDLAVGNGSYVSKGANHPVHSISWNDIMKWCNARSQKEGLTPCYTVSGATYKTGSSNSVVVCNWNANGYRLPTEAEWEKAARGGLSGKNFSWGDTISHNQANYESLANYENDLGPTRGWHPIWRNGDDHQFPYSSPVGSFAPNGYGLFDMAGNMCEFCWDLIGSYPPTSQTNPRGPVSGAGRVLRGGSWSASGFECRAAKRTYLTGGSSREYGFRMVRNLVP